MEESTIELETDLKENKKNIDYIVRSLEKYSEELGDKSTKLGLQLGQKIAALDEIGLHLNKLPNKMRESIKEIIPEIAEEIMRKSNEQLAVFREKLEICSQDIEKLREKATRLELSGFKKLLISLGITAIISAATSIGAVFLVKWYYPEKVYFSTSGEVKIERSSVNIYKNKPKL